MKDYGWNVDRAVRIWLKRLRSGRPASALRIQPSLNLSNEELLSLRSEDIERFADEDRRQRQEAQVPNPIMNSWTAISDSRYWIEMPIRTRLTIARRLERARLRSQARDECRTEARERRRQRDSAALDRRHEQLSEAKRLCRALSAHRRDMGDGGAAHAATGGAGAAGAIGPPGASEAASAPRPRPSSPAAAEHSTGLRPAACGGAAAEQDGPDDSDGVGGGLSGLSGGLSGDGAGASDEEDDGSVGDAAGARAAAARRAMDEARRPLPRACAFRVT